MNNGTQLENLIKGALSYEEDRINPSDTSLEKVKIILEMDKRFGTKVQINPSFKRMTLVSFIIFAVIFAITGGAIGVSAVTLLGSDRNDNSGKVINVDNTDYAFVHDPQVIGKWESVYFVNSIDEFSPDKKVSPGSLYLKELVFIKTGKLLVSFNEGNGNLAPSSTTWTKELILNTNENTASKYKIMDMGGSTYMFYEWKSGDYIYDGMQPKLYVLKKVDSIDYSNVKIPRVTDKTDYPFVSDPRVEGAWESVDFVRTVESFKPGIKSWLPDLYVTGLFFKGKGRMAMKTTRVDDPKNKLTWTNGFIISKFKQTASKYEIREMNGSTYLFFEWKNGDYIYRGMQPMYYVLKKVD
jgi:bla regulator protein BlaR1